MRRIRGYVLALIAIVGVSFALRKWLDVLQRRAETEQADRWAKERTRFLQRLDHELKNPLTALQVALANLEAAEDIEQRRALRDGLRGQVNRIGQLVGDLRKLALLEHGEIERIPVDLAGVLEEALLIVQDNGEIEGRYLDYQLVRLPTVQGDPDLLAMAVYNLLDNAIKFTMTGDMITLRTRLDGDTVVIEVRDTGRGVPSEDLPHVWEDLYRSRTARDVPGSGIGLALVKGIIERHGGTVAIHSVVGQGTQVTLRLATSPNQ